MVAVYEPGFGRAFGPGKGLCSPHNSTTTIQTQTLFNLHESLKAVAMQIWESGLLKHPILLHINTAMMAVRMSESLHVSIVFAGNMVLSLVPAVFFLLQTRYGSS
jgi:hypothetical protein